ncbi:MAG TPA: tyrosine-type recombinase/integrase, partial [Symbiobacteriaceae bacterium]|nr:tyrosine-type recombinase/integrase [Symbiobacteriaceae bacterium]
MADPRTINHKLGTLKSFLSHLRETLPLPQVSALPKITWRYKFDKKLMRSFNQAQLNALLAAVRQRLAETASRLATTKGKTRRLHKQIACCHRDLLMLVLMAGVGLRVGELCGLNLKDIDLADRSIRVLGKGRRERVVYFDLPQLVEAMGQYLQHRSQFGGETEAVFLNARDGSRLTTRAVELLLKDYLHAA